MCQGDLMSEKGISFKVGNDLKLWLLEQKIEKTTYTKEQLSGMEKADVLELAKTLGVEVPEEGDEDKWIDLILEDQEKYKANVWSFQNEKDAIIKMKELIDEKHPDPSDPDIVEKIGRGYNLQEVQVVEDKINLRAVSWLKVFLLSPTRK